MVLVLNSHSPLQVLPQLTACAHKSPICVEFSANLRDDCGAKLADARAEAKHGGFMWRIIVCLCVFLWVWHMESYEFSLRTWCLSVQTCRFLLFGGLRYCRFCVFISLFPTTESNHLWCFHLNEVHYVTHCGRHPWKSFWCTGGDGQPAVYTLVHWSRRLCSRRQHCLKDQ